MYVTITLTRQEVVDMHTRCSQGIRVKFATRAIAGANDLHAATLETCKHTHVINAHMSSSPGRMCKGSLGIGTATVALSRSTLSAKDNFFSKNYLAYMIKLLHNVEALAP